MNCGSTEHLTQACSRPELPREKRPCWKCGKPGHIGRDCRSTTGARLVDEEEPSDARHYFGVVNYADEDGYITVGKKGRPVLSRVTLGDFLPTAQRGTVATDEKFRASVCGGSAQNSYKCCGERPHYSHNLF